MCLVMCMIVLLMIVSPFILLRHVSSVGRQGIGKTNVSPGKERNSQEGSSGVVIVHFVLGVHNVRKTDSPRHTLQV